MLGAANDTYDVEPFETLVELNQACKELDITVNKSRDIILADSMTDLKHEYILAKETTGYLGIPYPVGWGYHTEGGKPKMSPKTGRQNHPLNEQTRGKQDGEFILLYGRPKCIVAGQKTLSSIGEYIPVETSTNKILSLKGHEVVWHECSRSFAGIRNAVRVTSSSGHKLETGMQHPFLTPDMTFKRAGKLKVGDYVAVTRYIPEVKDTSGLTEEECDILGYLVGDGNFTRNEVQFTKKELSVIQRVRELCTALGAKLIKRPSSRPIEYAIVRTAGNKNPILQLLRRLGLHGLKSRDKFVPAAIFRASNKKIARFISGYMDTDGSVNNRSVFWSSASEQLLIDVKRLLLRFGITANLSPPIVTNLGTRAYTLHVYSQEQHRILDRHLDLHNIPKRNKLHRIATLSISNRRSDDGIPWNDKLELDILAAKGTRKWKEVAYRFSMQDVKRSKTVSRNILRRVESAFQSLNLRKWINSDIRWEKIRSIEQLGKRPCWDKTMEEGEPIFAAGDFFVKNSLKTWLLIDMAVEDYSYNHCRTLIFTKEMSPEQLRCRFVARMLCVDYMDFKNGSLSPEQEKEFFDLVDYLKEEEERFRDMGKRSSLLITTGWTGKSNINGLASLEAKIDEFEPDVVYADAVYLMEVAKKSHQQVWQDIREISYGLKGMARDRRIPIVATSQANRKAEETKGSTLAEIAYGDSFGQACDVAIRIIKNEQEDGSIELACIISGGREIKLPGFLLEVEPAIKFQLKQIFESSRQIQALFRAEEMAIAQEQEREAQRIKEHKRFDAKNFHEH